MILRHLRYLYFLALLAAPAAQAQIYAYSDIWDTGNGSAMSYSVTQSYYEGWEMVDVSAQLFAGGNFAQGENFGYYSTEEDLWTWVTDCTAVYVYASHYLVSDYDYSWYYIGDSNASRVVCPPPPPPPLPEISAVNPRGNGYIEVYGNYFDTGGPSAYIDGQGAEIDYLGTTQINARRMELGPG
jgi:hypothetical protein